MTNEFNNRVGRPNQVMDHGVALPQIPNLRTHDEFGLSLDSANWVKKNCKNCNGRGIIVATHTMKASEIAKGATGSGNLVKTTDACGCALRAYQKVYVPLVKRVLGIWHTSGLQEDKKIEAIKAMIEEVHTQVKNAGKITSIRDMIRRADDAAKSMIVKPSGMDVQRVNRRRAR